MTLLRDYREDPASTDSALRGPIFDLVASAGLDADCPYIDPATGAAARVTSEDGAEQVTAEAFQAGPPPLALVPFPPHTVH